MTSRSAAAGPLIESGKGAAPLTVEQKRFTNRTRFEFGEDEFRYSLHTENSSHSRSMEYAELSTERETLIERNSWWRNLGLVWMGLGAVFSVMSYVEQEVLRVSIWLWVGMVCYGVYWLRTVRYVVIPAERQNVFVIQDGKSERILEELEKRRVQQLRKRYDYVSLNEHPDQQRHRIEWLRKNKVLDEHEASSRLLEIDTMQGVQAMQQDRSGADED